MRFVTFYHPARRRFFCTVKDSVESCWQSLAEFLGWKIEMVKTDCKVVVDLEVPDPVTEKS